MTDEAGRLKGRHPIQVVAGRTGLAPDRIRQWERRYGVVSPARSAGGHRLYSDRDVERLRLLARVVDAGRRIGDVGGLSDDELARIADEDAEQMVSRAPTVGAAPDSGQSIERYLDRIRALDAHGLESLLRRSASALGVSNFVIGEVGELLDQIGREWESGALKPSHEHMASAVLRKVLMELASEAGGPGRYPNLVAATPQGATHELGALMVSVIAAAGGWAVTYLGPDLPAEDIAWAADRADARVIALSIVHPASDPKIASELRALQSALPADMVIVLGGSAAASYSRVLDRSRCILTTLPDLPEALRRLR